MGPGTRAARAEARGGGEVETGSCVFMVGSTGWGSCSSQTAPPRPEAIQTDSPATPGRGLPSLPLLFCGGTTYGKARRHRERYAPAPTPPASARCAALTTASTSSRVTSPTMTSMRPSAPIAAEQPEPDDPGHDEGEAGEPRRRPRLPQPPDPDEDRADGADPRPDGVGRPDGEHARREREAVDAHGHRREHTEAREQPREPVGVPDAHGPHRLEQPGDDEDEPGGVGAHGGLVRGQ